MNERKRTEHFRKDVRINITFLVLVQSFIRNLCVSINSGFRGAVHTGAYWFSIHNVDHSLFRCEEFWHTVRSLFVTGKHITCNVFTPRPLRPAYQALQGRIRETYLFSDAEKLAEVTGLTFSTIRTRYIFLKSVLICIYFVHCIINEKKPVLPSLGASN